MNPYELPPDVRIEDVEDIRNMRSIGVDLTPDDVGLMQAAVCYASQHDGGFPLPTDENLGCFTVGFTLECLSKLRQAWLHPEFEREASYEERQWHALNQIEDFERRIIRRAFS